MGQQLLKLELLIGQISQEIEEHRVRVEKKLICMDSNMEDTQHLREMI